MNDAEHMRWTGRGNAMILRNLGVAALWAKGNGRLWIRTPIIPGATDSDENIRAIGERIGAIGGAERWELCAFNNLCTDKYERLDVDWTFKTASLVDEAAHGGTVRGCAEAPALATISAQRARSRRKT